MLAGESALAVGLWWLSPAVALLILGMHGLVAGGAVVVYGGKK